ncbi:hypothetical protein GX48_07011 [Paracoccidioides brasiliensis]|nr:hypothetical protein GX48_07011 [Paracoccidioides brasiliensis]
MEWPQLTLQNNQPHLLQSLVEVSPSPDFMAHAGVLDTCQRRCRRRRCLFHKVVEWIDGNEAQGYILIGIHGQYFILNTDTSGTWPTSEEQIFARHVKDYQASSKKKRGRRETLFRESVEYSGKCSADV